MTPLHSFLAERRAAAEVQVRTGMLRGSWRGASAAFLGIPFAAAPMGERRFLAPSPAQPWDGVRDATCYGPTPQRRSFVDTTTIPEPSIPGESTLNVNVFTPTPGDTRAKLPVLVWIHGGGYTAGSPASPWYDGRSFNRDGIVTVTISYRLGFDGFGWIDGAPLNRAILDQISALEWVQENIGHFGGDPGRVTIAGQSAGAGSVLTLLSAPSARGLFHGAIAQSGALSRMRPRVAREIGARMAAAAGIAGLDLTAWRAVPESVVTDKERELTLRSNVQTNGGSLDELIASIVDPRHDMLRLSFVPVVDDETVLDFEKALAAGQHRDTPLLLGTTYNEFSLSGDSSLDDPICQALLRRGISPAMVGQFEREARRLGPGHAYRQLMAQAMFRQPAIHIADSRCSAGSSDRTWLYDFRHTSNIPPAASHSHELPFVWDILDAPGVTEALGPDPCQELADAMHRDWVSFIGTGRCDWPSVGASPSGAMVYNQTVAFKSDAYQFEVELSRS